MDDPAHVRELDGEADLGERAEQALERELGAFVREIFDSVVPVSFFIVKNGSPAGSRPMS